MKKLLALILSVILIAACVPCLGEETAEAPTVEAFMEALDGYMYEWGTSLEDIQKDIEAKDGALCAYGDSMIEYYIEVCGMDLTGEYWFTDEGLRNVAFMYRPDENDVLLTMDMYREINRYFKDVLGYSSGRAEDKVKIEEDEFTYYYSEAIFYPPEDNAVIHIIAAESEDGELMALIVTAEQWP